MMKMSNRVITLDDEVAECLLDLEGAVNLSSLVNHILKLHIQRVRIEALEEILAQEHGPIIAETKA